MSNKFKTLVIGPDFGNKGGISRVSQKYKDNGLFNDNIKYLPSYSDGDIIKHIIVFSMCMFKLIYFISANKNLKIIHVTTASRGSFLRKSIIVLLGKLFRKKIIIHIRGGAFDAFYNNGTGFRKKAVGFILNKSDMILVLSEYWKVFIESITSGKNIKILYNPTIIKDINLDYSDKVSINILFMGRIYGRKGVYDIIEAANYTKSKNIRIDLFGDGEINKLKKLVAEKNLNHIISINDWITGKQVDKAYTNAHIFILPTYQEGLPNSVLEAISYGLPIISTPVGGIPEAVEDGINGFLIQPGDYKALAEKIDILANDKELRMRMGQEGYRIAKEKFDVNKIIEQLKNIYGDLLNESK